MAGMTNTQPIIIIRKKKGGHAAHHGGAWKVAYADFVTAMMALFIVLWLLSSSEQVQKAVGGYFTDPKGAGKEVGNGLKGTGSESVTLAKDDMVKLKDKLTKAIKDVTGLEKLKDQVHFTVTGEGLRVELLEADKGTFFESGRPQPTEFGKDILSVLAREIGKLPNKVTMEGHTDSKPFAAEGEYSNWELSADRANSARRWMQHNGMRVDQVAQVRGFADQTLRLPGSPEDASNRRVTLIIQYQASSGRLGPDGKEKPLESEKAEAKPSQKAGGKGPEKAEAKPAQPAKPK